MTSRPVLEIDGSRFDDLDGFWDEVSRQLIPGADWGRNLDAFNDILRGGFGTPEGGFVLRWTNSEISRAALGHEETVRWLERKVAERSPGNVPAVRSDLEAARAGRGPALFDILVEIIHTHGTGGDEADDAVELQLE
jgi:RNAse (barnase) inhibitor barstar